MASCGKKVQESAKGLDQFLDHLRKKNRMDCPGESTLFFKVRGIECTASNKSSNSNNSNDSNDSNNSNNRNNRNKKSGTTSKVL